MGGPLAVKFTTDTPFFGGKGELSLCGKFSGLLGTLPFWGYFSHVDGLNPKGVLPLVVQSAHLPDFLSSTILQGGGTVQTFAVFAQFAVKFSMNTPV